MVTHVGILPLDVLHASSVTLEVPKVQESTASSGLPFLRLPHPRTGIASLFLPVETGSSPTQSKILEVQAIFPTDERSWFIGEEVLADGRLLVMTPVDPVFLLIPILKAVHPEDGTLGTFRPAEDLFEEASVKLHALSSSDKSNQFHHIFATDVLQFASLLCVGNALKRICDIKQITPDIVVYRFSLQKTLEYLRIKVSHLSTARISEISRTLVRGLAKDGLMEDGKDELLEAGRTRLACDLLAQYLSQDIRTALLASYNFVKLDAHLKNIEDEAVIAATAVKDKSKKQVNEEKKRKTTKGSQGVEKLKKANVNGMAKLSSFFKKS